MRLKAFTILELVVVMVISSIVIAIASWVLIQFQSMTIQYYINKNDLIEVLKFESILYKDLQSAIEVDINKAEMSFSFDKGKTLYQAKDEFVIRNQGSLRDTFHLDVKNWHSDSDRHHQFYYIEIGKPLERKLIISKELDAFQMIYYVNRSEQVSN